MTTLKGTIRGKTIELQEEPGLPDGQEVAVTVAPLLPATSPTSPEALESLRNAAGGWADDDPEGLERYLEWNRQQRKGSREIPE